jgi:hypothetical protein
VFGIWCLVLFFAKFQVSRLNTKHESTKHKKGFLIETFFRGGDPMIKVKTFASPLKIFHARKELEDLDAMVNKFIEEKGVQKVISVSDAPTTDDNGATIGLIRVLAYE